MARLKTFLGKEFVEMYSSYSKRFMQRIEWFSVM